ncbi:MAG TPA: NIPSNAP family protein [Chloroflexota bacterium]|nr:NIPSNAP family protein [Chloroflexota bacterium]
MIYELHTYWAAPGKLDRLQARFRSLAVPLFARHGIQLIGIWTPAHSDAETGDLVYLLAFPDQAAQESMWQAFADDPEWQAGEAASEVDGPLVVKATDMILTPTDYSPLT